MPKLKTIVLLSACALASVGCASVQSAPQPEMVCPKPPAPPAWMMQKAPDLMTPLNGIISVYEPGLKLPSVK